MAPDGRVFIDQRRQTIEMFGRLKEAELRAIAAQAESQAALPAAPDAIDAEAEVQTEPDAAA